MSLGDIQPKVIGVNQGSAMQLIEQKILQVAVGPAVTFSNIPQNFSHLHLKLVARCADASTQTNLSLRLNGDGGSNYSDQLFITSNTSISAAHDSAATYAYLGYITANSATANYAGFMIVDFPNYTNTTFYKSFTSYAGGMPNSGANSTQRCGGGSWANQAAINSINIYDPNGSGFMIGSGFWLYGIV